MSEPTPSAISAEAREAARHLITTVAWKRSEVLEEMTALEIQRAIDSARTKDRDTIERQERTIASLEAEVADLREQYRTELAPFLERATIVSDDDPALPLVEGMTAAVESLRAELAAATARAERLAWLVKLVSEALEKSHPKEGGWNNECFLCGASCEYGPIPHAANCPHSVVRANAALAEEKA